MTHWEYKVIDSKAIERSSRLKNPSIDEAEAYLNELGAAGWEIVSLDWRELEHRMSFVGVAKRQVGGA